MTLQSFQPPDSRCIFLSYRSVEVEFALRLAADLKNAGINVWMDRLDIAPGDDWLTRLQSAVNDCVAMIAVLSPEYVASRYCQRELARADRLDRIIFPVLLHPIPKKDDWPLIVERSQYVDFTRWQDDDDYHEHLTTLIETIQARFSDQANTLPAPELRYAHTLIADLETRRGVIEYLEPFTLVNRQGKDEPVRPQPVFAKTWNMNGHFLLVHDPQDDRVADNPHTFRGIYEALEKHPCCMLVGGPGTGKTTTLNHLALESAHNYRATSGVAPLPLYLKLTRWEEGQSLAQFIRSQWPMETDPLRLIARGKITLYLDGLSELGNRNTAQVEQLRAWLNSEQAPQRIVIACRESDYENGLNLGLPIIKTVDLTIQHIHEFVDYYLDEGEAEDFLTYILPTKYNPHLPDHYLSQIAHNPYLLSVMIVIYKRADGQSPFHNVGTVMQHLVSELWQSRRKQNNDERLPYQRLETALADLAFALIDNNMPVQVPLDWAIEYLGNELLLQAAINANFLEIDSGRLRFPYQMLQDYFAAVGLHSSGLSANLNKPEFDANLRRVPNRWDNAVHILAGISTDTDSTLLTIAETDPYLALSCALHAAQVQQTTFDTISQRLISTMEGDRRVAMAYLYIGVDNARAMLLLLAAMRDGLWQARCAAAHAVAEMPTAPLLEGLLGAIDDLENKSREAASAFLKQNGADALPGLIQLLHAANWNHRRGAVWALGELKDKAGVPLLVPCLDDPTDLVAAEAAVAIGRLKDEHGIAGLIGALKHESWRVGKATAKALAFIGKPAVPALLNILDTKSSSLRQQVRALEALGGINDDRAVHTLLVATHASNPEIRGVAVEGLRNKRSDSITHRLIELLDDHAKPRKGKQAINEMATEILEAINTDVSRHALENYRHRRASESGSARLAIERLRDTSADGVMAAVNLSPSLTSDDWMERKNATLNLAAAGSAVAVPRLITALKDEDSQVRLAAVNTLVLMKDDIRVMPTLLTALSDPDLLVCDGAKEALKKIARPPVPGLIDLLRGDDVNVRGAIIEILGSIKDAESIPDLLDCLTDIRNPWLSSDRICDLALRALEAINTPEARRVVEQWRRTRQAQASKHPVSEDKIAQILHAIKNAQWEMREEAAKALRNHVKDMRGKVPAPIVQQLLDLLTSEVWIVRWSGVLALAHIAERSTQTALLEMLKDPHATVRVGAILALAEIGDRHAIPFLLPLLDDRNSSVREATIEALGMLGDPRSVEHLIALLKDPETLIRITAIIALGKLGDRRATMPLMRALRDADIAMRWFSADALGKLQDPTAVNELVLLLQDQSNLSWEEKKVCEVAAEALENIGTPEACAAILNWRSKQAGTK